jgi:hypothetical protein
MHPPWTEPLEIAMHYGKSDISTVYNISFVFFIVILYVGSLRKPTLPEV